MLLFKQLLQVALLRGGWNELLIAGFAHRSMGIQNGERRYIDIVDIHRYLDITHHT